MELVAIFGIFMLGGIAVIASSVRVWALWIYFNAEEVNYEAIHVSV